MVTLEIKRKLEERGNLFYLDHASAVFLKFSICLQLQFDRSYLLINDSLWCHQTYPDV